jgi:hypothetical protein
VQFVPNLKAAVNAPQSRRFAYFGDDEQSRQRLDCGGFSTALGERQQLIFICISSAAKKIPSGQISFRVFRLFRG